MKAFILFAFSFCFSFLTAFSQNLLTQPGTYLQKESDNVVVWANHPSPYTDSSDIQISDRRVAQKELSITNFTVILRGQKLTGSVSEKLWDRKNKAPEPLYIGIPFSVSKVTVKQEPIILISSLSDKKKKYAGNVTVTIE